MEQSELARNVLCSIVHAWSESGMRKPLGADKAKPSAVRRFSRLCGGATHKVEDAKTLRICLLSTITILSDDEMCNVANYCGKSLRFANREIWGRSEDVVSVVLFIGENGLDPNSRVFGKGNSDNIRELCRELNWTERFGELFAQEPCFVVVTQGMEKEQIALVKRALESVFDLEIVTNSKPRKCANLRGLPSSWMQSDSRIGCLNPALKKALEDVSRDVELLCLSELGLEWKREGDLWRRRSPSCAGWICR